MSKATFFPETPGDWFDHYFTSYQHCEGAYDYLDYTDNDHQGRFHSVVGGSTSDINNASIQIHKDAFNECTLE